MTTATPFLAAAADAKLEDWGPLEESRRAGDRLGGTAAPRGWTGTWQVHETIRKLYVLF